ncbi:MAG TPA: hypothetical protein VFN41_12805 [Candidatus Limnocylindrales bacterium]|nr:hypothetical protein [Candidatus Limnocylindrales bacterium]
MATKPSLDAAARGAGLGIALAVVVACGAPTAGPTWSDPAAVGAALGSYLEDVKGAAGKRYGERDDRGHELDGLTIMAAPDDGFVGVSHWWSETDQEFRLGLSTSEDLLTWTWRAELARKASQPAIAAARDGGYVVAWEQEPDNHLAFAWYRSWDDLLEARASKTFQGEQQISDCAEGTPNLISASSKAVDFGFHYFADCDLDREARGTMDWRHWSATKRPELDAAVLAHGVAGGIGDRDVVRFRGREFMLVEAMSVRDDWSTWKVYLIDGERAMPLTFATDGGSGAFTNPSAEVVDLDGESTLVVSLFVPKEGAAPGEVGSLVYYVPIGGG